MHTRIMAIHNSRHKITAKQYWQCTWQKKPKLKSQLNTGKKEKHWICWKGKSHYLHLEFHLTEHLKKRHDFNTERLLYLWVGKSKKSSDYLKVQISTEISWNYQRIGILENNQLKGLRCPFVLFILTEKSLVFIGLQTTTHTTTTHPSTLCLI